MHICFDPATLPIGINLIKRNPPVVKHICIRVFAAEGFEIEKQSKKQTKKA